MTYKKIQTKIFITKLESTVLVRSLGDSIRPENGWRGQEAMTSCWNSKDSTVIYQRPSNEVYQLSNVTTSCHGLCFLPSFFFMSLFLSLSLTSVSLCLFSTISLSVSVLLSLTYTHSMYMDTQIWVYMCIDLSPSHPPHPTLLHETDWPSSSLRSYFEVCFPCFCPQLE